jgi:hypothetical protein
MVPRPQETTEQREASRLLGEWLQERLRSAPVEQRRRVIEEAQADLARLQQDPDES